MSMTTTCYAEGIHENNLWQINCDRERRAIDFSMGPYLIVISYPTP